MGAAAKARVTLIRHDGQVLGDSIWSLAELNRAPNHNTRPEIMQVKDTAVKREVGKSKRYSESAQEDLMYVALAAQRHRNGTIVRLSLPLSRVDNVIWTLEHFC